MNINNQHFMKPSGVPTAGRLPTTDSRHPGDFRHPTTDGPEVGGRMSEVEKDSRKSDVGCRMSRPMKPSGVPWLGDIPAGWDIVPSSRVFSEIKQKAGTNNPLPRLAFRYGEIVEKECEGISDSPQHDENATCTVVHSDVIMINGLNLNYDLLSQRVAIVSKQGVITSAYLAVAPATIVVFPRFAMYLFKGYDARMVFHGFGSGIRKTLKFSDFKDIPFLLPPLSEQRAIADFLDEKCAAIDAIVEEAKSGIEEYAKWKQSVVFQAVTKGIPEGERHPTSDHRLPGDSRLSTSDGPDVESRMSDVEKGSRKSDVGCRKSRPMKDSGVEWIGEIPEEWKVEKLRFFGMLKNGISKGGDFFGEGSPFVSYSDVFKNDSLPEKVDGLVLSSPEEQDEYSVRRGDVFFTRTSETIDDIGKAAVCLHSIPHATFAGFLIRVRPQTEKMSVDFSKYYFRNVGFQSFFSRQLTLVTRASLSQNLLKNLAILLPPLPEQRAIAAYLDEKCSAIDALIEEKKQLIEDLGVYKKSLIYETVTGKRLPTADGRLSGDDRLPTSDGPKVGSRMSEVEKDSRRSEVGSRKLRKSETT